MSRDFLSLKIKILLFNSYLEDYFAHKTEKCEVSYLLAGATILISGSFNPDQEKSTFLPRKTEEPAFLQMESETRDLTFFNHFIKIFRCTSSSLMSAAVHDLV